MLAAVRAAMLAGLLVLPSRNPAGAAQIRGDTAGLDFLGFRPGARLEELNEQLRNAGSEGLRCRQARADRRVSECRGFLRGSDEVPDIALWISAIDSVAGIMTLFGRVDSLQLDDWRTSLEHRYGRVGLRVQGSQSMLQWVRRGRMIRLTWRVERREQVASVSLVDGHVLDGWGRARTQPSRTR